MNSETRSDQVWEGEEVKVPVFMLANAAGIENGLLNVHGGGWGHFTCDALPSLISGMACGIVELEAAERTKPLGGHLRVRDHTGSEMGAKSSFLARTTPGDGPIRLPFVLPFSFVVQDIAIVEFAVVDDAGDVLASFDLPLRDGSA